MRPISIHRDLRNSEGRLLCKVNDQNGVVETKGPHNSRYVFTIPTGGTFTVTRGAVISRVTRTAATFDVVDTITTQPL